MAHIRLQCELFTVLNWPASAKRTGTRMSCRMLPCWIHSFYVGVQWKAAHLFSRWEMTRRKPSKIWVMDFCGAIAATSLWMWFQSWSQEWWDCDMNGFIETDLIWNVRILRGYFSAFLYSLVENCAEWQCTVTWNLQELGYDWLDWGGIARKIKVLGADMKVEIKTSCFKWFVLFTLVQKN